jgi:hypothetical protein
MVPVDSQRMDPAQSVIPAAFVAIGIWLIWNRAKVANFVESLPLNLVRLPRRFHEVTTVVGGLVFVVSGVTVIVIQMANALK